MLPNVPTVDGGGQGTSVNHSDDSHIVDLVNAYVRNSTLIDASIQWGWGDAHHSSVMLTFIDFGLLAVPLKRVKEAGPGAGASREALANVVRDVRHNVSKRAARALTLLNEKTDENQCLYRTINVDATLCDPAFKPPERRDFSQKFCSRCRTNGILVPSTRLRALSPEAVPLFENVRGTSFWCGRSAAYGQKFRLVNHTKGPPST